MRGSQRFIFAILVNICFSKVLYQNIPSTGQQRFRFERDSSCREDIDLNLRGGIAEIKLPTVVYKGAENYRAFEDCTWTLKTAEDHFMILKSDYFSIEKSENCVSDFVEITEKGFNGTSSRYCGWDPLVYITLENEIKLQFKSDDATQEKGFKFIVKAIKQSGDDSECIGSVSGGAVSNKMNDQIFGGHSFFRIQAPEDKVISLTLKMLDFGESTCAEESIIIYEGHSTHGRTFGTICSDNTPGLLPYRARSMFIEYRNPFKKEGERYAIEYMFEEKASPVVKATYSSVEGNDDDDLLEGNNTDSGTMICTSPQYKHNKKWTVAVCNDQLPRHVVQMEFSYLDKKNSVDCIFDSLKLLSGEREVSSFQSGHSCGENQHAQTVMTSGTSLRLEFNVDESVALKNFQTKISFVPNTVCLCKDNEDCYLQAYNEKCVYGKPCEANICQNGGTCHKVGSESKCTCPKGFHGDICSERNTEISQHIRFIVAPFDRVIKRGNAHLEECVVDVPSGDSVEYNWTLEGTLIGPYNVDKGFGVHPGGLLQIDSMSDELEGVYTCFVTTSTGSASHTFEYKIAEDCDVRIFPGPQSEIKKIGEMALLICRVHSRAKEVRWRKDGLYIDFDIDGRIKKLSNNYLRILNVRMTDAGVYQCEAEDTNGCYSYKEGKLSVIDVQPINKYCGQSIHDENLSYSSRISKGNDAAPGMNPWHVTMRSKGGARRRTAFCGGTLLSQRYFVTVASCVNEFTQEFAVPFTEANVEFLIGTTDCLGTQNDGQRRTVRNFFIHPNFKDRTHYDNDIALIELDSPVKYTNFTRPICIEPADYIDRVFLENSQSLISTLGKVAGCGAKFGRLYTEKLQEVYIPYVDRQSCIVSLGRHSNFLTDTMFCAGRNIARTGDTCAGDSGSGLIMTANRRWVLTGLVSWGFGCDKDKHYGIYTNVGMFYDWIESITKFNEEEMPNFLYKY